ncbi:reverse transcriptase domain-containing protein [Tanacetum coccineum]
MGTMGMAFLSFYFCILFLSVDGNSEPSAYEVLKSYNLSIRVLPRGALGYTLDRNSGNHHPSLCLVQDAIQKELGTNTRRRVEYVREGAKFHRDLGRHASDAATYREVLCDMNYHKLLPIIAKKVHQEKVQQEKLKAVKACLNFEEASQHSELGTPSKKRDLKKRLGSRHVRSMSGSPEPRRGHSESPRKRDPERKTVFKRLEKAEETLKAATRVLAQEKQSLLLKNVITKEHPHEGWKRCQKVKVVQEVIGSQSQRGKSRRPVPTMGM